MPAKGAILPGHLQGTTDVLVVGAGVIGLAIAWKAAAAGLAVTVCDADPGGGASWAAAGMLAPVTEASMAEAPLAALGLTSLGQWPGFAAQLEADSGIDPGLRSEGTLAIAFDEDDRRALEELLGVHRALGLASEWVGARECRRLEPLLSPRLRGGLRVHGDWQVDNRALLAGLRAAVARRGAVVRLQAVRRLLGSGEQVQGAELDDGTQLHSGTVILACGAWSGRLEGVPAAARPPVRPVKGDILRLAGPEPLVTRTIRAGVQGRPVYLVPRRNGELVVGASMEEAGFEAKVRTGAVYELLAAAVAVLPAAAELELVEATARLRPGSPDNAPILGPTPVRGLLLATGHHRNGMLLAPLTAEALVQVALGGPLPDAAAPFTLSRFQ